MQQAPTRRSKLIIILTAVLLLVTATVLHRVYAGKSSISLNSPVSFPVDI